MHQKEDHDSTDSSSDSAQESNGNVPAHSPNPLEIVMHVSDLISQ